MIFHRWSPVMGIPLLALFAFFVWYGTSYGDLTLQDRLEYFKYTVSTNRLFFAFNVHLVLLYVW